MLTQVTQRTEGRILSVRRAGTPKGADPRWTDRTRAARGGREFVEKEDARTVTGEVNGEGLVNPTQTSCPEDGETGARGNRRGRQRENR